MSDQQEASPALAEAGSGEQQRAGRSLLAGSATVSVFNALGVLAGFALDALVAAWFGVGLQTDAYFSAYRLPNAITSVITMVAGAALVPMFARMLSEMGREGRNAPPRSRRCQVFSATFLTRRPSSSHW